VIRGIFLPIFKNPVTVSDYYLWVNRINNSRSADVALQKKFTQACFLFIAFSICPSIVYYGPHGQAEFCKGRCSLSLAHEVLARVGGAPLYLYRPIRDQIRGLIPFYENRTVRELDLPEEVPSALLSSHKVFVLTDAKNLPHIQKNKLFASRYTVQPLSNDGSNQQFVPLAPLETN
jgi:hypothetical protein